MERVGVMLVLWSTVAVQAWPGVSFNSGSGYNSLMAVPDFNSFSGLHYPQYNLQELGTIYEGQIPSEVVKISNTVAVKIPKPYPVKIPHNVPIPVPVAKPYPVPVPQLIKVPQPVPVEVIKSVPVPVEVPKPYPVPYNEYKSSEGSGGFDSYGGSNGDHQQLSASYGLPQVSSYGVDSSQEGHFNSYQGQESSNFGGGHEGGGDQSVGFSDVSSTSVNHSYSTQEEQQGEQQQEQGDHN